MLELLDIVVDQGSATVSRYFLFLEKFIRWMWSWDVDEYKIYGEWGSAAEAEQGRRGSRYFSAGSTSNMRLNFIVINGLT